jgi:hypothetical protein
LGGAAQLLSLGCIEHMSKQTPTRKVYVVALILITLGFVLLSCGTIYSAMTEIPDTSTSGEMLDHSRRIVGAIFWLGFASSISGLLMGLISLLWFGCRKLL